MAQATLLAPRPSCAGATAIVAMAGLAKYINNRLAWYTSVATSAFAKPADVQKLGDDVAEQIRAKAAFIRGLSDAEATALLEQLKATSLTPAQLQACFEGISSAMPGSAGQAVPTVVAPKAAGPAVPTVAPISQALPATAAPFQTAADSSGQQCKFHYNYWKGEQWNRFLTNNPSPQLDQLLEMLVEVCLMIGLTHPTEPCKASIVGLIWSSSAHQAQSMLMPASYGHHALQVFKQKLEARRPEHIDRAMLLKVFPESPDHMSPEWRRAVYGDANWVHYKCPLEKALLIRCLQAVPARGNNHMLTLERSGARQDRVAPRGNAHRGFEQPFGGQAGLTLGGGMQLFGQAGLTAGGQFPGQPRSDVEAVGGAVLSFLARGGPAAEQVKDLLRASVQGESEQPRISIFGSARRSPTKEPLALGDEQAEPPRAENSHGQAEPPRAANSPGQVLSPTGSEGSRAANSSGQVLSPTGSEGPTGLAVRPPAAHLFGALDQVAKDVGSVAPPKMKPSGMKDLAGFIEDTKKVILKRPAEDADEDASEDDEDQAEPVRAKRKANAKGRAKAKAKGKAKATALPVEERTSAKGKAKAKAEKKAKAKDMAKGKPTAKAKAKAEAKSTADARFLAARRLRLVLGCPKCRGCETGCAQCWNPKFGGSRGPQ